MNNVIQRTLSGSVFIVVIIATILLSRVATECFFLVITALLVNEFHLLMKSNKFERWASVILTMVFYLRSLPDVFGLSSVFMHVLFGVLLIFMLISLLFVHTENPIHTWGRVVCSIFTFGYPMSMVNDLLALGEWSVQRYILLAVFVCLWANDTGAFCVGSLFGKHKMAPRISPGKTWEGLVGGFIFSLVAGGLFAYFEPTYTLVEWLSVALFITIFGTFGDLAESLFKRTIGVKDSGKFLPGHGGVLDRFDSFLLALPATYFLFMLLNAINAILAN